MRTLKQKVQDLKAAGFLNSEIAKKLGCSKGTVGYHATPRIRQTVKRRHRKWKRKNVLAVKLHNFKYQNSKKREKYGVIRPQEEFRLEALMKKIGAKPCCYLTGTPIDLNDKDAYCLNHIVPHWEGGRNTLDNCGLATAKATQAKGKLTWEQFVELCRKVVEIADGKARATESLAETSADTAAQSVLHRS